jgi:hypothetical protein
MECCVLPRGEKSLRPPTRRDDLSYRNSKNGSRLCEQSDGWGGRIRTSTIRINSAVSYRLDHAPVGGHITIRCNTLVDIGGVGRNLVSHAGASSGASWSLWNSPGQPLNGG